MDTQHRETQKQEKALKPECKETPRDKEKGKKKRKGSPRDRETGKQREVQRYTEIHGPRNGGVGSKRGIEIETPRTTETPGDREIRKRDLCKREMRDRKSALKRSPTETKKERQTEQERDTKR